MYLSQELLEDNERLKKKLKQYENALYKTKRDLHLKLSIAEDQGLSVSMKITNDCLDIIERHFKDIEKEVDEKDD